MACPDLYERTIVLNGVSNPASISQKAAQAALTGDQGCIEPMLKAFRERHDYVFQSLKGMDGVELISADGTFYSFPNFERVLERLDGVADDVDLAEYFLTETGVALVPGSAFGSAGCVRIMFATSMDNLVEALERIAMAVQR